MKMCFMSSSRRIELELKDREEGRTALSWAIDPKWAWNKHIDYTKTIQLLLAAGCDPDSKDSKSRTPLSYAASTGKLRLVELLLDCETVDPDSQDKDGWTPLFCAVAHGHEKVVEALLNTPNVDANVRCRQQHSYNHGETLLCLAAARGNLAIVNMLLSRPSINLEAKDGNGRNALMQAAMNGHADVVRRLLELEVFDVNRKDNDNLDMLSAAAMKGHSDVIKVLAESNAIKIEIVNEEGRNPLSLAAEMGHGGVVEQLLKVPIVDPNSQDRNGRTPLSWAVGPASGWTRRTENAIHVTELLLRNKDIKINLADNKGWTPLSWAVQQHEGDAIVELLLATVGIDVNYKDTEGRTPIALAKSKGCDLAVGQLQGVPGINIDSVELKRAAKTKHLEEAADNESIFGEEDRVDYSSDSYGDEPGESERHHLRDELRKEMHLSLVPQTMSQKSDDDLCKRCEEFDLDRIFSWRPKGGSGDIIAKLGIVDDTWELRTCAMCRLIAAIRPGTAVRDNVNHELRSFSSTDAWLCQDLLRCHQYFQSSWIDTVFLAVVVSSSDRGVRVPLQEVLRSGFIARVGSNCRNGLRALTVRRMKPDQIDFSVVRSWIDCCINTHFKKRCKGKPNAFETVPHLKLIDCANRKVIVPSPSAQEPYVALSYVWGPYERPELDESNHLGKVEAVVEDAMHVTLQLGFTYLWVDRHCISQNDKAIMKEQLDAMNILYRNSELTIIAAAGSNSSFGLPGVSHRPRKAQACSRIKGHILTSIPTDPTNDIIDSKWHTRGWTYQEGLLSRRRLMFTEHEVSYECHKLLAREAIALPMRIYRMSAKISSTRFHPGSWSFPRNGVGGSRSPSRDLFALLQAYTSRDLTYDYDILNAMLGIFQAYEEFDPPVYHLCGVPMLTGSDSYSKKPSASLEGFTNGLCWFLNRPAARRSGFPSWSWTGWKGVVGAYGKYEINRSMGFAIYISIVLGQGSLVPWDVFEQFRAWERKPLQQYHVLEITGAVIELSIRKTKDHWGKDEWDAFLYHGDEITRAHVYLDRTPSDDVEFSKRLLSERWLGLLIGNSRDGYGGSTHLLVLDQKKSPCERIAYAWTVFTALVDEGFERRTFRLG
jgi:ankyrin repeat protein